jgi:hypothetical protein
MTAVTKNIPEVQAEKFNAREFVSFALAKISDSIGDMIISVAVLGLLLFYIVVELPMFISTSIPGLIVLGFMVQLLIRIVHRFDDHYTVDELALRMIEMEHDLKEQLDRIEVNQ